MISIREIDGNACRDIVEGQVKLTPTRTVPAMDFVLTPRKPEPEIQALMSPPERADLDVWWDKYRRLIGTMGFTSRDLANFFVAQGWQVDDPLKGAKHKLDMLYDAKVVDVVGRVGRGLIYKVI